MVVSGCGLNAAPAKAKLAMGPGVRGSISRAVWTAARSPYARFETPCMTSESGKRGTFAKLVLEAHERGASYVTLLGRHKSSPFSGFALKTSILDISSEGLAIAAIKGDPDALMLVDQGVKEGVAGVLDIRSIVYKLLNPCFKKFAI